MRNRGLGRMVGRFFPFSGFGQNSTGVIDDGPLLAAFFVWSFAFWVSSWQATRRAADFENHESVASGPSGQSVAVVFDPT